MWTANSPELTNENAAIPETECCRQSSATAERFGASDATSDSFSKRTNSQLGPLRNAVGAGVAAIVRPSASEIAGASSANSPDELRLGRLDVDPPL